MHAGLAQLAVTQTAHRIVFIKALLRLCGGFHIPFQHRQTQACRHLPRQLGLAGARLALHQQRPLQRHRRIHRDGQIVRGNIPGGRGETHGPGLSQSVVAST